MRQIQLTQGKYALVDDKDYDFLMGFKWHAVERNRDSFYAETHKLGSMHRVILGLKDGHLLGDHKDGDTLNNQRENLRACTSSQNNRNRKSSRNGTSKYLGVSYDVGKGKWRAQITVNYKNKKLGWLHTELDAAIIYNIAARKYHGRFARPNVLFQPKHPYTHSSPIVVLDSKNGVIVY